MATISESNIIIKYDSNLAALQAELNATTAKANTFESVLEEIFDTAAKGINTIDSLRAEQKKYRDELVRIGKGGAGFAEVQQKLVTTSRALNAELKKSQENLARVEKLAKLNTKTLGGLKDASKIYTDQLDKLEIGSEEYLEVQGKLIKTNKTLNIETKKLSGNTEKATTSVGGFSSILKGVGAAIAAAGIANLTKEMFDLSSVIEQRANKANVVFGNSLGFVKRAAEENANAIGLTRGEFVGLAAGTADILKPLGFLEGSAARLATGVTNLAGDLSKWDSQQRTSAELSQVLNAALTGERESLKSLGIVISEAEITRGIKNKRAGETYGSTISNG